MWLPTLLLLFFVQSIPVAANPAAGPAPKPTSVLYEDGLARMSQGDHAGAIIQFKNVLQQDPNQLPARIALGKANLRLGDAADAEKELRIALGLGAASDQVFPTLGNALLAQRKYAEILETIKSPDLGQDGGFEIVLLRGRAHYELGQHDAAGTDFDKASRLAPDRPEPLLGLALIALAQSKLDDALVLANRALEVAPNHTETWFRKGEILRQMGDDKGALEAYEKSLSTNPNALRVRLARAALRLQFGELEAALDDIQFVRKANPDDISASFLLWQIHERSGESEAAKVDLADVNEKLNLYTDEAINKEPLLLRIAALAHYANRDLVRTAEYLARYVQLRPNDTTMHRLNGQVLLLLGDAKAAIQSLYPLYRQDPKNHAVLISLGQAYLQIGHYGEAETMFAQAQALYADDSSLTAQLALSRVGLGSMEDALTGLQDAIEHNKGGQSAAMLLTVLQFKDGNREGALHTIEELCARMPQDPRALNLLGVVRAAADDMVGARDSFEQSAKLAPDYVPPIYNLAKLELAAGNVTAATARLEAVVARDPRSDAALTALADIAVDQGDKEAAARWLDKAVAATPDAMNAQARLVELRLSLKQEKEAMAAAARMVERNPEDALAVETMAMVEAVAGRKAQAIKNFRHAARYASYDGDQLMRIAQQQVNLEDFAEARRTLVKATNSAASDEAVAALIRLEIQLGEYAAVVKRIDELRADSSSNPLADIFTAELHMQRNEIDAAIAAYQAAQQKMPSTTAVLGLADAFVAGGDFDKAIAELENWLEAHPDDQSAQRKLALIYLPVRRFAEAEELHDRLLKSDPDDPILLGNLARLYQIKGDKRAREVAEKALNQAPLSATALDTMGWILVTEGETLKGLELLREAISRQNNPLIRYHLAQALSELGRTNEAKAELKLIIKDGHPPDLVAEVQRFYDALESKH